MEEKRLRWPLWLGMVFGAVVLFAAGGVAGIFLDRALSPEIGSQAVRAERVVVGAQPGVLILEILPDSPAAEAGLESGDEILAIDGQNVVTADGLVAAVASHKPDDEITLSVRRSTGPGPEPVRVRLSGSPTDSTQAYLGVRIVDGPTPHLMALPPLRRGAIIRRPDLGSVLQHYDRLKDNLYFLPGCPDAGDRSGDVEAPCGLVVAEVVDGSPAETAGLQVGDLILELDGEPVASQAGFVNDIGSREPGDEVRLTVYRERTGDTLDLRARLGQNPSGPGKAYLGVTVPGFFRSIRPGLFRPYGWGHDWIPFERTR